MCYPAMSPPPKGEDLIPYTYCPHIITRFEGQDVLWSGTGTIAFCPCCLHYMCGKCHSHHPDNQMLEKAFNKPQCHWNTRRFIFMVERFGDLSQAEQGAIWRDAGKRHEFYMETPV
jgi:hypothetical protein